MTQIFYVVLSLSVSGALVGLLVLLFSRMFGRLFSKSWTYCLWLLVIARLLVPVHGDVNLMEYLSVKLSALYETDGVSGALQGGQESADGAAGADAAETRQQSTGSAAGVETDAEKVKAAAEKSNADTTAETLQNGVSGAAETTAENAFGNAPSEAAGSRQEGMDAAENRQQSTGGEMGAAWRDGMEKAMGLASVIWFFGVIITVCRKLWIYRSFVKEVRAGCIETADQRVSGSDGKLLAVCGPVTDERVLVNYTEIRRRLGIRKHIPLYESAAIDSPMLIGFRKPCIYLPSALLAEMAGREYDTCLILHHELIHYKRRDICYKWLFQAALCVHWFNPLVYVFNRKFNVDCELACDEAVLRLLSEEGRRAYGNVLLDVAQKNWSEGTFFGKGVTMHRNIPTMTLLEEKGTLKERLREIAQYHKTGLAVGLCSAAVLVLFLGVAFVCGAADVHGGLGQAYFKHNHGNLAVSLVEHFWENSMWSEMWKDSFDLDQPIKVSSKGKAYRMYDDDALIAEESENDWWRAWVYSGGDRSVDAQKFAINGSDTLWIFYANKETTLEISSVFSLYDGRFKLVCVRPDQTVQILNESGEENTVEITLPQGRNVIKIVGQKAKLEGVNIAYGKMIKGDFDGIYTHEVEEYAYQVLEGKKPLDPSTLEAACPYLKEKDVSELSRKAWEQEVALTKENWQYLFVYSDSKVTAQYLLEELQAGKVAAFDSGILVAVAPYMEPQDVSECFRYLLERDAVYDSDWEYIFVYSDADKSAEYLAKALRKGKVSSFSDKAIERLCYQVSTKRLTDIVTAMRRDELTFEGLEHVLAFVQRQDEAVTCICYYIDLGNVLTDSQLQEIEGYLDEEDFYRVVEYNGRRK